MTISAALDRYWRLDSYDELKVDGLKRVLSSRGFKYRFLDRSRRFELVRRLQRLGCGSPVYDKIPPGVLQKFIQQRGLKEVLLMGLSEKNRALVVTLEDADDQPKFHRFMDLPAELRSRIYDYYTASFPQVLRMPTQPPLARVSRQMRQEVLPVFYSRQTFTITYHQIATYQLKLSADSSLFLHNLAPRQISNVRRLQISLRDPRSKEEADFRCIIDLRRSATSAITVKASSGSEMKAVLKKLEDLIGGLGTKGGRKAFQMRDVHNLRRAVETGLVLGDSESDAESE
ncbi:hypothetical protein LTR37_002294 [Vermiconidia calcicola]|uniref:Uncharacterized protein n=1 Tax=Vermiconidia calcicola TaxID=1690605 RepID=A0ACC3NTN3_9PEZI|nr:hypothetical protein LTR37_002294 [Vermiconidia calcicola]